MKLFLLFFTIGTIFISTASYAQTWMVGVRGGINFANQAWTEISPNVSFNVESLGGGQIDYWFNPKVAASFQILFDQKGASAMGSADGPPGYAVTWTSNYIELPLFIKVNPSESSFQTYLFGGPSIGFLISNTENGSFRGSYTNGSVDITDSTKKMDLSIVLGVGISSKFQSGLQFIADVGFAIGLINTDNYLSDKDIGIGIYSRDIRLAAGILFPIR